MSLINKYLWLITSSIIIITSIYFSIKEKFPQLRLNKIFKSIISNNDISIIDSLMMSLASKIGVGSIAGIALAIKYGGLGTIFWIWIVTILISSISYIESKYGEKYQGGPHIYIDKILKNKYLSKIYAFLMLISYGIGFITIQSNTISVVTKISTNISIHIINIIILFISIYFLYSKTKNKSKIISKIVPIMTLLYLVLGFFIIFNTNSVEVIKKIIIDALNLKAIKGSLIYVFTIGMQRAIFSTEVAIGTSAISSSMISNNNDSSGYVQILSNYITTFIICTITALIILTSNYEEYVILTTNGIELSFYAFGYHFQKLGQLLIWICIFLFAISTIISGFFYGESCLEYLTKNKTIKKLYKIIVIIFIYLSTYISATTIWNLVDITVAVLCLINIYAIIKIYLNKGT